MKLIQGYKTIKGRVKQHPIWLTHVISYKCNAKCEMCARWQKEQNTDNELSKEECFQLLDNAINAGIIFYTMYGGEPLLYKYAPEVLAYAKQKKLITAINTNGYFLSEKYEEISQNIDSIIVSIDAIGEKHDQMRKLPGLFNRAVHGIKKAKQNSNISINSVITAENKESVPDLIQLSNELKVPVFIQTIVHVPGINDHLMLTKEEKQEIYRQLLALKNKNNRLLNSKTYLKNILEGKTSKCHTSKVYIRVEGDGTIGYCNNTEWGNIRNTQLSEVFNSSAFKNHCKLMENCNKCLSACTDVSKLYNNPFYAIKIGLEYLKYQK